MGDFAPLSGSSAHFARSLGQPPSGWPGDGPAVVEPPPDEDADPPADATQDPPDEPQEPAVRVPDEVLDPVALVPASSILARIEVMPVVVAAKVRAEQLVAEANAFGPIEGGEDRERADALRDDLKKHDAEVEAFLGPLCDAANKLHKGATGIRSFCKGDVLIAAKKLGDGIAASMRREEEAEAARQRAERERLLAEERARLKQEAEAEDARQRSAAAEALVTEDPVLAAELLEQAAQAQASAAQARQDAATITAPAVARQEIARPKGASTRANWKALPANAEDRDDMPVKDKIALILGVADRLRANDASWIHLLDPNWKGLDSLADGQKATMNVPGVRAVNLAVYAKRSKG